MFNATNARTAADAHLNELTDRFAAEWEDRSQSMTLSEREELMKRLLAVLADPNATQAFVAGQYAQQSNGQSAAIGTGQSKAPTSEQEALNFLLSSGALTPGIKKALTRLLSPQASDFIDVGADGTPVEVGDLRQELASTKADLADERNPNKRGSLAQKLSAAAVPVDMVAKADVKTKAEEVKVKIDAIKVGMMRQPVGIDEAKAAINDLIQIVS